MAKGERISRERVSNFKQRVPGYQIFKAHMKMSKCSCYQNKNANVSGGPLLVIYI